MNDPIEPQAETPEIRLGNWLSLPPDDLIVQYLADNIWEGAEPPGIWETARRSKAVYVYREVNSRWQVVAKFFSVKTGEKAEKYAQQELALIEQARQVSLTNTHFRAIRPYGVWRGVLFLEFVDGLTLEDIIAVRRSRPGTLMPGLSLIAQMLALLHSKHMAHLEPRQKDNFTVEALKIVDKLSKYGVLKDNPVIQDGLIRQIRCWAEKTKTHDYIPALNHGDATTTNFIFTNHGKELVVIDWERSRIADPAADLGRIMAEIEHSVSQHGGELWEVPPLIEHFTQIYTENVSNTVDTGKLLERARYYRAITSLRIARNGWLPRLERTRLVAQAMALLV